MDTKEGDGHQETWRRTLSHKFETEPEKYLEEKLLSALMEQLLVGFLCDLFACFSYIILSLFLRLELLRRCSLRYKSTVSASLPRYVSSFQVLDS